MSDALPARKPPKLPWKYQLLFRLHSFALDFSRRSNMTVNRRFMALFDPKIPPSSKPRHGVFTLDTTIDPSRNLWVRLFVPSLAADTTSMPVVIYFHGGGFAFFSANSLPYDDLGRRLARDLRAVVISVNYRLSPEFQYPTPYEDGLDALKFLDGMDSDAFPVKADFSRCFIAGDSAGGNLAHNVAVRASEYVFKKVKVRGLIAIQPFFGGEERTESEMRLSGLMVLSLEQTDWYWKAFLPKGSNRNHVAAHVVGGEIPGAGFPGALVIVGGFDQLQDWGRKYSEWLKRAGKEVDVVEYPNAIHGFYAVPELPEASKLMKDVRDFIQKLSAN